MGRRNVNPADAILEIAREHGSVTNRDAVARLGITRQAVHRHLEHLVARGLLRAEGAGRSVRYRIAGRDWSKTYPLRRLAEETVWREIDGQPWVGELKAGVRSILSYAVTEIVNNAIDHSDGRRVEIAVCIEHDAILLCVRDDGIGALARVRAGLGLESELDAIAELSKGKVTTQPDRHSGEGLFFVSKIADAFRLESNSRAWIVDNRRDDVTAGPGETTRGTMVRFEIARSSTKSLRALFDAYTEDFEFVRTRIVVRLFEHGTEFVSRSEAKRLLASLEKFREVVLDFRGVKMVGQGFADEVFRVWTRAHPAVVVRWENASEDVEFMVRRAIKTGGKVTAG